MEGGPVRYVSLVMFFLDGRRYGLPLHAVERVLPALDVTPLPKVPDIVLGLINLRGRIIPVLDMRKRFRLPSKELAVEDHFIIAKTAPRTVALPVDAAMGVVEVSEEEIAEAKDVVPGAEYIDGIVKLKDGMLLIHDVERFLSLEEGRVLEEALKEGD